jgi:5-formyltetrahydrofolate cyclo-ligase
MNPTKSELRRKLKQARLAMPPEERQTKSTAIVSRLWEAIDWSQVTFVHCFEPIERLGEVDISDFVAALRDEYPNIRLFTSRQIDDVWQVVSLADGKSVPIPQFDVIIVPMLGFDGSLHRIGYGGGYYDCFLTAQPQARKIGVCFETGKLDQVPAEAHDVSLDMIVTDSAVYGV